MESCLLSVELMAAGVKKTPVIFNFDDKGKTNRLVMPHAAGVCSMVFTKDGSRLLTGDNFGNIVVWDVARKARVGVVAAHTDQVTHLLVSSSGKHIVSSSHDGDILIWPSSSFVQSGRK